MRRERGEKEKTNGGELREEHKNTRKEDEKEIRSEG